MSDLSHWGSAISLLDTRLNRTSSYAQERAAGWPKVEVRRGRTSFWRSAIRMASSSEFSSVSLNRHYSCAYVCIRVASCHEFLWETGGGKIDFCSQLPEFQTMVCYLYFFGPEVGQNIVVEGTVQWKGCSPPHSQEANVLLLYSIWAQPVRCCCPYPGWFLSP